MADTNEQGQGTGTPSTGTPIPSQNTNPGTSGQPSTSAQGTTGTPPAPTGFTFTEDRKDWVPPHRIREISEKQRQSDARATELERQIQALTNTQPKDDRTKKAEDIKSAFYELFPRAKSLMELSDEQLQQLLQTPAQVQSATQFVNQGWERHAKQMTGSLVTEVSEIIGSKLDDDSQQDLKLVFGNFIQREVQKAEQTGAVSPELQKYLDGDDSLMKDFAKKWADRWFTPARRQVVSQQVNRSKPVPNSTGRSQQTSVERPKEFKTMEDRLNFLADKAKEQGVHFTK